MAKTTCHFCQKTMTKTKSKCAVKINTDMKRQSLKTGRDNDSFNNFSLTECTCMYGYTLFYIRCCYGSGII